MSSSPGCCRCRENEALQEREVKSGPMGCRDLKEVQVDQDQTGQRYCNHKETLRLEELTKQVLPYHLLVCTF